MAQRRVPHGLLVLLHRFEPPGCAGNEYVLVRVTDDGLLSSGV